MQQKSLKIAMLGHKRIPSREGGIEVVVEELSTRMVKKDHQVTCYNRKGHHVSGSQYDAEQLDEYKGVELKYVWTIERKGFAALTSSLAASIKAALSDADVVHIHAEGPAAMCWIPKMLGKKVVVTIHGLDWKRSKWGGFASRYIRFGERQAVKWADQIIVLSKGLQEYFMQEYGRESFFISNGVDKLEPVEAKEIDKQWGLKKDSYVLFLGRIVPEKGLRYLVDAWNNINTEKKLVIAGGSSDTLEFINGLKNDASENVIFTGFQQGRVLEELYSNAYFYVLPSDIEGMPLSLLEAMSYGNCCLVSDIPECKEVVEDNAVIFNQSDTDNLRDKIQMLIDNTEIVRKYKSGTQDYITKKYNWDNVVDYTLKTYCI